MDRRSNHLLRLSARRPLGWLFVALLFVSSPGQSGPPVNKNKPQERLSLPQGSIADAWTRAGFRLGLAFSVGALWGQDGAADATLVGATIRAGWRFNRRFSLLSTFTYHVMLGDMAGLRYAIMVEPTWHPVAGVSLGVGAGYAGIVGDRQYDPEFGGASTVGWPSEGFQLRSCSGGGVAGVLRAGYLFRFGRIGSTGPVASLFAQASRCAESDWYYETDVDTGTELVEWWPHMGFSLAWTFLWR